MTVLQAMKFYGTENDKARWIHKNFDKLSTNPILWKDFKATLDLFEDFDDFWNHCSQVVRHRINRDPELKEALINYYKEY